jgi:hypothetical protein
VPAPDPFHFPRLRESLQWVRGRRLRPLCLLPKCGGFDLFDILFEKGCEGGLDLIYVPALGNGAVKYNGYERPFHDVSFSLR